MRKTSFLYLPLTRRAHLHTGASLVLLVKKGKGFGVGPREGQVPLAEISAVSYVIMPNVSGVIVSREKVTVGPTL